MKTPLFVHSSVGFQRKAGSESLSGILACVLSLVLAFGLLPCVSYASEAETLSEKPNVATPTQEDIRNYVESQGIDLSGILRAAPTYAEQPSASVPYALGELSSATKEDALSVLNLARYVAGVPSNVTLSEDYNQLAQAASLVNCANGGLSHDPVQPAGMDGALYNLGKDGAGSSNLGMGYVNPADSIVRGYLSDADSGNIRMVGHRRWVLNPPMTQTGFGQVGNYTAMYAFDHWSGATSCSNVAWPAQNMPVELFDDEDPWSLSVGTEVSENVTVTLTRLNDGESWTMGAGGSDGELYVDNGNYGQKGCVIFRPYDAGGALTYASGDTFQVRIVGAGSTPIEYQVNFFDLVQKATQTITCQSAFAKTYGDQAFQLNASAKGGASLTYRSSDENVATVSSSGLVSVWNAGVATITITAAATDTYAAATKEVAVTVSKLEATITALDATMVVDGAEPLWEARVDGLIGTDRLQYHLECDFENKAGQYPIRVVLDEMHPNYDVTVKDGVLSVVERVDDAFADVQFEDASVVFDGAPHALSVTGAPAGTTVTYRYAGKEQAGTPFAFTEAGSYSVSAQLYHPDYGTLEVDAVLTIEKAAMEDVAFEGATFDYDGEGHGIVATGYPEGSVVTYSCGGEESVDQAILFTKPGSYEVAVAIEHPNYDLWTGLATVTISGGKSPQSIDCQSSFSKVYGDSAFSLGAKAQGDAALSYTSSNTDVAVVLSDGTVVLKGAGSATVTIAAAETETFEPATKDVSIYVQKAIATITANSLIMELGDEMPQLTARVEGLVGGDVLHYRLDCDPDNAVGSYPIVVILEQENPNYTVFTNDGTLSVIKTDEAAFSGVVFESTRLVYDGQSHGIVATGYPDGTVVTYVHDGEEQGVPFAFSQVGEYVITARLYHPDYGRYEVSAVLTIAEEEEPGPVTGGFTDVGEGDWFATEDVLGYVLGQGLFTGYPDGRFGPYEAVSRGQVATILWRMAGEPRADAEEFVDVDYSFYYGDAIKWARATGVISGYGANDFRPERSVSREEMAKMLTNYAKAIAGIDVSSDCSALDSLPGSEHVSSWAREAMGWAVDNRLISGDVIDGALDVNPGGITVRCAAAKMTAVFHRDVLGLGQQS